MFLRFSLVSQHEEGDMTKKANAFDFLMLNADSKQYIKESAGPKWSVALQLRHHAAVVMLCEQNQQRRSSSVQTEFIMMAGFTKENRCALSLQRSPNADTARGCVPAVDTNKDWHRVATFSQCTKIKISKISWNLPLVAPVGAGSLRSGRLDACSCGFLQLAKVAWEEYQAFESRN